MLQRAGAKKLQDPYGASTRKSAQARLKAMRTDCVKMNDLGIYQTSSCWDRRRPRLPVSVRTNLDFIKDFVESSLAFVDAGRRGRLRSQYEGARISWGVRWAQNGRTTREARYARDDG